MDNIRGVYASCALGGGMDAMSETKQRILDALDKRRRRARAHQKALEIAGEGEYHPVYRQAAAVIAEYNVFEKIIHQINGA